ncbi:MAG: ankyrin repeat domain-containing protein [Kiloniellales bacterium]|nr:ankyrin repeat domain-containing protein [Kiloniellales bacterium]
MSRIFWLSIVAALILPMAGAAASNKGMRENALVTAIRAQDNDSLRQQLDAGADPNRILTDNPYCCEAGSTPFMVAAAQGNTEAMQLLAAAGADIGVNHGFYGTALHAAARKGQGQALRWLLDAGVDPNTTTAYNGLMPLHVATLHGQALAVALLVQRSACVDCTYQKENGGVYSPLADAAASGHRAIVEILVSAGADLNKPCGDAHLYGTPLAHAAQQGRADIVEILVAAGADLNPADDPPLHGAASMGHTEIVMRLVELGADIDARDLDSRTALTLARNHGHDAVADYLEKAMAER